MIAVGVLVALFGVCVNPDLEELLARNRDGLALIQTVDAKIEADISLDDGSNWKPAYRIAWSRDADRQRITERQFIRIDIIKLAISDATLFADTYRGPDTSLILNNWDPDAPPRLPLGPVDHYGGIKGTIAEPAPKGDASGLINEWWFFNIDGRSTLSDLARNAVAKRVSSRIDSNGGTIFTVELRLPNGAGDYTIELSERHNSLIRKVVAKSARLGNLNKPYEHAQEITAFSEAKPGVWVPSEMTSVFRVGGLVKPLYKLRARMVSLEANEPIADADIKFDFPPGLLVYDHDGKMHIWGKGKPERTFSNVAELMAWEKQVVEAGSSRGLNFVLINLGLLALVIFLLVLRRRVVRSEAA